MSTSALLSIGSTEVRAGHRVNGLESRASGWTVSGSTPAGPFAVHAKTVFVAAAGLQNLSLVSFLVKELAASPSRKFAQLRRYLPLARRNEWTLLPAGQRAQLVKPDRQKIGVLQQGTELVVSADGSIAGLLGASPGASTAVPIMVDLLKQAFPAQWHGTWKSQIAEAVPDLDRTDWTAEAVARSHATTDEALGLSPVSLA